MDRTIKNIGRGSRRYRSLRTKVGISFAVLTITISAIFIFFLYQSARYKLQQGIRQRVYDIVSIAALQIDGDAHSTLVDRSQEGNDTYMHIKTVLQNIRDTEPEIRYVYTWRRNADGQINFVVDAETDHNNISHLGDSYGVAEGVEPALLKELAVLKSPTVDKAFSSDKWGLWLSGYAPFYRSDGQMEGILGIDIASTIALRREQQVLWNAIIIFFVIIPVTSISGWLLGGKLAEPIMKLTAGSERIIKGDLNHRVSIESSDEVGILAKSFNKMTETLQKTIADRDEEITQRKKAEELLGTMNEDLTTAVHQLSRANREIKEFTYITAHDLKSPIRAIGNLAGMILSSDGNTLNEQSMQDLNMLIQRAERLNEFVEDLSKYSTLEQTSVQKKDVDVNDALRDAIAWIGVSKGTIEITVAEKMPVVTAMRTHIIQIFQKLLENAVKYMDKPKGRIKIDCVEKEDFWEFSVADNGCGIEEKYFDKIFQIFQILTRRDDTKTVGIGLSMARKIVEIYGGKIWVESEIGEGSTFFFTFPKQKDGVKDAKLFTGIVS